MKEFLEFMKTILKVILVMGFGIYFTHLVITGLLSGEIFEKLINFIILIFIGFFNPVGSTLSILNVYIIYKNRKSKNKFKIYIVSWVLNIVLLLTLSLPTIIEVNSNDNYTSARNHTYLIIMFLVFIFNTLLYLITYAIFKFKETKKVSGE